MSMRVKYMHQEPQRKRKTKPKKPTDTRADKARAKLKKMILKHARSDDFQTACTEFRLNRTNVSLCGARSCICGQPHLHFQFFIVNNVLHPERITAPADPEDHAEHELRIGSDCIKLFPSNEKLQAQVRKQAKDMQRKAEAMRRSLIQQAIVQRSAELQHPCTDASSSSAAPTLPTLPLVTGSWDTLINQWQWDETIAQGAFVCPCGAPFENAKYIAIAPLDNKKAEATTVTPKKKKKHKPTSDSENESTQERKKRKPTSDSENEDDTTSTQGKKHKKVSSDNDSDSVPKVKKKGTSSESDNDTPKKKRKKRKEQASSNDEVPPVKKKKAVAQPENKNALRIELRCAYMYLWEAMAVRIRNKLLASGKMIMCQVCKTIKKPPPRLEHGRDNYICSKCPDNCQDGCSGYTSVFDPDTKVAWCSECWPSRKDAHACSNTTCTNWTFADTTECRMCKRLRHECSVCKAVVTCVTEACPSCDRECTTCHSRFDPLTADQTQCSKCLMWLKCVTRKCKTMVPAAVCTVSDGSSVHGVVCRLHRPTCERCHMAYWPLSKAHISQGRCCSCKTFKKCEGCGIEFQPDGALRKRAGARCKTCNSMKCLDCDTMIPRHDKRIRCLACYRKTLVGKTTTTKAKTKKTRKTKKAPVDSDDATVVVRKKTKTISNEEYEEDGLNEA